MPGCKGNAKAINAHLTKQVACEAEVERMRKVWKKQGEVMPDRVERAIRREFALKGTR